jgi:hypothetical protein
MSKLNYLSKPSLESLMYRRGAIVIYKNSVSTITIDHVGNMGIYTQLINETFVRVTAVLSRSHNI